MKRRKQSNKRAFLCRAGSGTLLGNVVSFGEVWRTGANRATHFTTSESIRIANIALPAGSYTLWTLPSQDSVLLIMNRLTNIWGTRYNAAADVSRAPLATERLIHPIDTFTMRIDTVNGGAALVIEWDHFRWRAEIR